MIVVFGCDQRFLPHLSVAIASLLHNNSDSNLQIYIIHSDINLDEWNKLVELDTQKKHTFINAKIDGSDLNDLTVKGQFTKATYYRLLIEDIVLEEKALYLDADIVVNGSLKDLWNIDISDTYIAAVEEPLFTSDELGMQADARYFNAGVMLINLKKWRDESISHQVIEFIRKKGNTLIWLDQCALNAVINGRWKRISPKFNLQTTILTMDAKAREDLYDFGDITQAINNPAIIHFTGHSKPWHLLNDHPFKKKYWQFLKITTYNRFIPIDTTPKRLILWCLPKAVRNALQNYVRNKTLTL